MRTLDPWGLKVTWRERERGIIYTSPCEGGGSRGQDEGEGGGVGDEGGGVEWGMRVGGLGARMRGWSGG